MLDEDRRVLLVRFAYRGERWWAAPNGGLEDDETHEEAARWEVAEETGFELEELGLWVWSREDVFRFEGRLYRQRERYFLASVPVFEPRPKLIGAEEAMTFDGLRWWTLEELETTDQRFAPANLSALLRELVEEGPPEHPVLIGAWHTRQRSPRSRPGPRRTALRPPDAGGMPAAFASGLSPTTQVKHPFGWRTARIECVFVNPFPPPVRRVD